MKTPIAHRPRTKLDVRLRLVIVTLIFSRSSRTTQMDFIGSFDLLEVEFFSSPPRNTKKDNGIRTQKRDHRDCPQCFMTASSVRRRTFSRMAVQSPAPILTIVRLRTSIALGNVALNDSTTSLGSTMPKYKRANLQSARANVDTDHPPSNRYHP